MRKVNFISDKKILSWNDKIKDSNNILKPIFASNSSFPLISIWYKDNLNYTLVESIDPELSYIFSFSVSSNKSKHFFDILEKLLNLPFGTKFLYKEVSQPIDLNSIEFDKKEEIHKLLEKEYIRYTYKFSDKLSRVISYISCIEDTISYFEKIWGYDENGNEHCLLKYPIGSIVSIKEDKSKDYLVLEYSYEKDTNDNYSIKYYCSEILNTNSPIIKYGDINLYSETDLCFSRNNRIDDVLN
jgi:hypothetical protein